MRRPHPQAVDSRGHREAIVAIRVRLLPDPAGVFQIHGRPGDSVAGGVRDPPGQGDSLLRYGGLRSNS